MKTRGNLTIRGLDRKATLRKEANRDLARDDLTKAYSGKENKGPAQNEKKVARHGTHLKNRRRGANINQVNNDNATEL